MDYDLAGRISDAGRVVVTVKLPLIDRAFVLHRKAHGQKGSVCGPLFSVPPRICGEPAGSVGFRPNPEPRAQPRVPCLGFSLTPNP